MSRGVGETCPTWCCVRASVRFGRGATDPMALLEQVPRLSSAGVWELHWLRGRRRIHGLLPGLKALSEVVRRRVT